MYFTPCQVHSVHLTNWIKMISTGNNKKLEQDKEAVNNSSENIFIHKQAQWVLFYPGSFLAVGSREPGETSRALPIGNWEGGSEHAL